VQIRAVIYTRQSLDRDASGDAVARQLEACERLCAARGWEAVARFTDNSVSAFSGKPRPGYDRALRMLDDGLADLLVACAVDRLTRSVTDLEALISLCERTKTAVATVSGDLDLSTDQGRLVARILGSVARGEVERKGTRQRDANEQKANRGEPRKGCPRPFGWNQDRIHIEPAEAEAIREAARAILGGGTLSALSREWSRVGLRPGQSPYGPLPEVPWTRGSIRTIMLNPKLAGITTYRGEEIEGTAQWEPILPVETFTAVKAVLTSPSRGHARGVRTMLGGLARCVCGNLIVAGKNRHSREIYRCRPATRNDRPAPHVAIKRQVVDAWVEWEVLQRLYRDDAHSLVGPGTDVDVAALRDEAAAIRRNLDEMAAARALGIVTRTQLIAATKRGNLRLTEIETALADAGREDIFLPLLIAEDTRAAWSALTTDRKRALVGALFEVTLLPPGRGRWLKSTPEVLNIPEMEKIVSISDRIAALASFSVHREIDLIRHDPSPDTPGR
jgi:site-specific DNA recombinase